MTTAVNDAKRVELEFFDLTFVQATPPRLPSVAWALPTPSTPRGRVSGAV